MADIVAADFNPPLSISTIFMEFRRKTSNHLKTQTHHLLNAYLPSFGLFSPLSHQDNGEKRRMTDSVLLSDFERLFLLKQFLQNDNKLLLIES